MNSEEEEAGLVDRQLDVDLDDFDEDRDMVVTALRSKITKLERKHGWLQGYSCLLTLTFIFVFILSGHHVYNNPPLAQDPAQTPKTPIRKPKEPKKTYEGNCLKNKYALRWVDETGQEQCKNLNDKISLKFPQSGQYKNNEFKKWCLRGYVSPDAPSEMLLKVSVNSVDIEVYDWLKEYRPDTHEISVYNNGSPKPDKAYGVFFDKGKDGEYCLKFESDSERTANGFSVDLELMQLKGDWSAWSECETHKVTSKKAQFNGACGLGFTQRKLSCAAGESKCIEAEQRDICDTPVYCTDYDVCTEMPESFACEDKAHVFNGQGRKEPSDPHVFTPGKSDNKRIVYNSVLIAIRQLMTELQNRHADERALTHGVTKYSQDIMDDSRKRLGLKLARSLLLGEKFIVGTTGSSNTAGHDNMFISSYPMQLQSILKPFWQQVGLEGAYFEVRNTAIGGKLGTESQGFCVRSQVGEDADVVIWESFMNDGGRPALPMLEVHLRNTLKLPSRPLWHTVHAGTCDRDLKIGQWKRYDGYRDITTLAQHYQSAGAGNLHFKPCQGLEPLRDQEPYNQMYVTWHPSAKGHRAYAEIIAYEYLSSMIAILDENMEKILSEVGHGINAATRDRLRDLLKDPEMTALPTAKECGKFCEHESICISGLRPLQPQWELHRFVRPETKWARSVAAHHHDVSGFDRILGEQGPMDHKWAYVGKESSIDGWFRVEVTIPSKGLWIHKPYKDHSTDYGKDLFVEGDTLRIKLDGKLYECNNHGKELKLIDKAGCFFEEMPSGKHILEVAHDEKDQLFAIHLIISW